jgi:hypothetical protein
MERGGVYRVLVGKPEGSIGRLMRRWEDNNKMGLQVAGFRDMDWISLVEDSDGWQALVNAVMNFQVPQNGGWGRDFLTS